MSEIKALEKLREKIRLDVNNPWSDLKGDLLVMCEDTGRDMVEPNGFCAWGVRKEVDE